MRNLKNEIIGKPLTEYGGNNSLKLYFEKDLKVGIAEAVAPYVSLEEFMDGFKQATEMIRDNGLSSFVFDKRSLRAFHQPSMEWYFVQWKPKVRDLGLLSHYKILPDEDWFRKCVEAGRKDILDAYGEDFLNGITISYTDSVKQAFSHIGEHQPI